MGCAEGLSDLGSGGFDCYGLVACTAAALRSRFVATGLEIYAVMTFDVGAPLCRIGVDDLIFGVLDDGLAVRASDRPRWDHHLALAALLAHHDPLLGGLKSRIHDARRRHLRHLRRIIIVDKHNTLCIQTGIIRGHELLGSTLDRFAGSSIFLAGVRLGVAFQEVLLHGYLSVAHAFVHGGQLPLLKCLGVHQCCFDRNCVVPCLIGRLR